MREESDDRSDQQVQDNGVDGDPVGARLDAIRHDLEMARDDLEETLVRARLLIHLREANDAPAPAEPTG
jgi:hypothetical protein